MGIEDGVINPAEIIDLSVRVFVSHKHRDHWDARVLEWKEKISDIEYFFGWGAFEDSEYHHLSYPRGSYKDKSMTVFTVNSHHSGVPEAAFLIQVDGLVIFHGGDYQGKMARGAISNVAQDMDYLRNTANLGDANIDLLFVGAWIGGSNATIIEKLNPAALFPMHNGGKEAKFEKFVTECRAKNISNQICCPTKRGDSYLFMDGKIKSGNLIIQ